VVTSAPAPPAPAPPGGVTEGSPSSPGTAPPTTRALDGVATTLTGTIEAGVESGCVVLTDGNGTVLANLIGLDTATTPFGSSVEVTGKFQAGMMTTCMQGTPFAVAKVEVR